MWLPIVVVHETRYNAAKKLKKERESDKSCTHFRYPTDDH